MTRSLVVAVLVLVFSVLASCQSSADRPDGGPSSGATYTCPMHPDVAAAQPGRCPRCGMGLVPGDGSRN